MDRNNSNDRTTAGVIAAIAIIASIALLALAGLTGSIGAAIDENTGGSDGEIAGAAVSAASVADSINYQGRLTDSSGSPLSGTYGITFRLYDVSTGGVVLATDTHDVNVTNGLFNTGIDFDQSYFDGRELWLGVTVGTDLEMTPRQELRPVPYAFHAKDADKLDGQDASEFINKTDLDHLDAADGSPVNAVYVDDDGNVGIGTTKPDTALHIHQQSEPQLRISDDNGYWQFWGGADFHIMEADTNRLFIAEGGNVGIGTTSPGAKLDVVSDGNSDGVHASSANSYGVYGEGGKYGGYFTTNQGGSWEDRNAGVNATTTHDYSDGVRAFTSGDHSTGIRTYTSGYGSDGVVAETYGNYSEGVYAETYGDDSDGVQAYTTGDDSEGVYAHTTGYDSDGVYVKTTGNYSYGVYAYTEGDDSEGVCAHTTGDDSEGVCARTHGYGSEGVDVATYGDWSYGVHVNTTGTNSKGVYVNTTGAGSEGVYAKTAGDYSYGVRAWTTGVGSDGVLAYSEKSHGVYAVTGRSDHNYGVMTPDKMCAYYGYDTSSADVAEYFPAPEDPEPGTVMVIDPAGGSKLRSATNAYDTTVAGIVSTAPGVSLGTKEDGNDGEKLIAVAGRVPCKVDASYAAIKPGDLLTTSDTPGYAMKAQPVEIGGIEIYRPGTTIGKALAPLDAGTGTIEVLVTLQ